MDFRLEGTRRNVNLSTFFATGFESGAMRFLGGKSLRHWSPFKTWIPPLSLYYKEQSTAKSNSLTTWLVSTRNAVRGTSAEIPNFTRVTSWVVLLISRSKFRTRVDSISSTFQICMGSDTSSWKFYALSSEVISADCQATSQLFCIWQFGAYGQPLTPIGERHMCE